MCSMKLMDSAPLVIGCHSTQEWGFQNMFEDVASTIHQYLPSISSSP